MNAPYLLFPIGVLTLLLYLVSHFLVQNSIIAKTLHRKIWNSVLLLTFLITALLGLILTVEVNYKLVIPYIKTIMVLHVDFGIAMSIVGIVHFLWHWSYYTRLFKGEKIKEITKPSEKLSEDKHLNRNIFMTIALLGFGTIVTQVILLREMINIFSGNELITGIVLASWMTLTGLGAWTGRSNRIQSPLSKTMVKNLVWLGILPIIIVVILYATKHYLFQPGVLIDIRLIFPLALLLLAPYCLLSGHLFAVLGPRQSDRLYAIETAGGVLGGIIVSFIMIFWLSSIQSLLIINAICLLVAFIIDNNKKSRWKYLIGALIVMAAFILPSDMWLKGLVFPNQEILKSRETPYGNIVVTQSANQINFFGNHDFLYNTQNAIENEETVHYTMLQLTAPKNVLLLSGNPKGLIHEILKYKSISHIDYVEENLWLLKIIAAFDTLPIHQKLMTYQMDARNFLNITTHAKYDVAILAVPEPTTLQANRYYTLEFFRLLKTRLSADGVIGLSLPSAGEYLGAINVQIHSIIVNTLKSVFTNVLIIPGEKDYVIASTQPLSSNIATLSQSSGIENTYVNPYYIDDFSLAQRINLMQKSLIKSSEINMDFKPLAVYYSTSHYINKFSGKTLLITLLPLVLLMLPIFRLKPETAAIYISGFSIAALEIILLLFFQIIFGFVYAASGVIISACMAGLALGAMGGRKWKIYPGKYTLIFNQLLIGFSSVLFVWLISKSNITWNNSISYLLFFFAVMVPSVFAGFQFSLMVQRNENKAKLTGGHFYAVDLFGSAIGAALVSLVLLPVYGIQSVLWVISILNVIALVLLTSKKSDGPTR
jgi:predicted membrane-bound spermidine synthase